MSSWQSEASGSEKGSAWSSSRAHNASGERGSQQSRKHSTGVSLQDAFDQIDTNADGAISKTEFKAAMTGRRRQELRALFDASGVPWETVYDALDVNHDKVVRFDEFQKAAMPLFFATEGASGQQAN